MDPMSPRRVRWGAPPDGTRTFALVMDAPGRTWVHWALYDLPAGVRELPQGIPADAELASGARQGRNDFGKLGYGGPCPPPGPAPAIDSRFVRVDPGRRQGRHD